MEKVVNALIPFTYIDISSCSSGLFWSGVAPFMTFIGNSQVSALENNCHWWLHEGRFHKDDEWQQSCWRRGRLRNWSIRKRPWTHLNRWNTERTSKLLDRFKVSKQLLWLSLAWNLLQIYLVEKKGEVLSGRRIFWKDSRFPSGYCGSCWIEIYSKFI